MRHTLLISLLSLLINFSNYAAVATTPFQKVERNLFDVLMMGNYKSGMTNICAVDQKCIVTLSKIECALEVIHNDKSMSKKGNCTFKNRKSEFGVVYNEDAFNLASQLIVYGAVYRNNGAEIKLSVDTAICAGEKNAQGQF